MLNINIDASNPSRPHIVRLPDLDEGKTVIKVLVGIGHVYDEDMCTECPHLSDWTPKGATLKEYSCQYYQKMLDSDMAGPYRCDSCMAGSVKKYEIICPASGGIEFHG